jgi:hypothetical protein
LLLHSRSIKAKYFTKSSLLASVLIVAPARLTVSNTSIPAPSIEGREFTVFVHGPFSVQDSHKEHGPAQKEKALWKPALNAERSACNTPD